MWKMEIALYSEWFDWFYGRIRNKIFRIYNTFVSHSFMHSIETYNHNNYLREMLGLTVLRGKVCTDLTLWNSLATKNAALAERLVVLLRVVFIRHSFSFEFEAERSEPYTKIIIPNSQHCVLYVQIINLFRYGTVAVKGEVEFGFIYNFTTGSLDISIKQCRELAPVDTKRNRSDPWVTFISKSKCMAALLSSPILEENSITVKLPYIY